MMRQLKTVAGFLFALFVLAVAPALADPLPSWRDTGPKQALIAFVETVTTPGSADYVDPAARIATFDNDGTLWIEQPVYTNIAFSIDRTKALLPEHPDWAKTPPYSFAIDGNLEAILKGEADSYTVLTGVPFAGLSVAAFEDLSATWLATARHPRFDRRYTELAYQPMLELLVYLRDRGFKTFIVSGGGIEFMRAFADGIYGIPPEQVLGAAVVTEFRIGADGKPEVIRTAQAFFDDNGPDKAVGIEATIGRRPILAFGNSDGDLQMLQWTAAGEGARFMGLVHHTDAVREYAYDRDSLVGRLDKAWDAAVANGWTVVSMKDDWARIFPFQKAE